jgi:hypothetical protein
MNKCRQLLSILLVFILMITAFPATATAEDFSDGTQMEWTAENPDDSVMGAESYSAEEGFTSEEAFTSENPEDEFSSAESTEEAESFTSDSNEDEEEISLEQEAVYINPLYADVIQEEDLNEPSGMGVSLFAQPEYCTTVEESAALMREYLKARVEEFSIYIQLDSEDFSSATSTVISQACSQATYSVASEAMSHTGNPTEGDYLKWQYAGWKSSGSTYHVTAGICYYTIKYTMTYYTTLEQEEEVDERISEVLSQLNLDGFSTYRQIQKIYDYICTNVKYDYTNLNDSDYKLKYTAYAALINGTSVCQGYAVLLYRMALMRGIDVRVIPGMGNGGNHAWNIVEINGKYYNLDSTWDAGSSSYSWFLKSEADFSNHVRSDNSKYADVYYGTYSMSDESYTPVICADHGWKATSVLKSATCKEEGQQLYECTLCPTEKTEVIPCVDHALVIDSEVAATCATAGKTAGSHCDVCGEVLTAQQVIPATGEHTVVTDPGVEATCVTAGKTAGSHCVVCGTVLTEQQVIPATGEHTPVTDPGVEATCVATGKTEGSHCDVCETVLTAQEEIPISEENHIWSSWTVTSQANVFTGEIQSRTCSACGRTDTRTTTKPLTAAIKLSVTSLTMKYNQTVSTVKVTGLARGDSIQSWTSKNKKIATIAVSSDGTCTIKAKSVSGTTDLIITLASGKTGTISVKVQSGDVKTTKVSGIAKTASLQKGKTLQLSPVLTPFNSTQKVTYQSSNTKVATVTSKGKIKAVGTGKAKITVLSGTKKAVCTITVTGPKTTKITNIKSTLTLKKGSTKTLKPKLTPSDSVDKITYKSSKTSVVSVSSGGVLTAKKKGTAVITVKSGSVSVKCTVTVK